MIVFDTSAMLASVMQEIGEMEDATGERAMRSAGFAGAAIFRDEAKRNAAAHRQTGTIMNNIIVKRAEERSDGSNAQTYLVTVRSGKFGEAGDAFYWRFVEHGHKFVPRKRKGKSWKAHRAAAELEYGTASAPAYPFMGPALDSKMAEAIEVMREKLFESVAERRA
jgi:HK97 gp10 family phage protein